MAQKLRAIAPVFYPFVREVKRVRRGHSAKLQRIERAFFTRYVFTRADPRWVSDIREIRDVLAVVSVRGSPLVIPDKVIESIRALGDEDGCMSDVDFTRPSASFKFKVGDLVSLRWPDRVLDGFVVQLASLSRLDTHGEVGVFVKMLGSEREVRVPARVVSAAAAVG